jgi:hypothetical protein
MLASSGAGTLFWLYSGATLLIGSIIDLRHSLIGAQVHFAFEEKDLRQIRDFSTSQVLYISDCLHPLLLEKKEKALDNCTDTAWIYVNSSKQLN